MLYGVSGLLYFLLFFLLRFRRKVAEGNIRNSFPEMGAKGRKDLLKGHYRNFCDVVVEIAKSIRMRPAELGRRVVFTNVGAVEEALRDEQTVLLSVAHHCNHEWAMLTVSQLFKYPLEVIYKPLHIDWLEDLANESRARFDITLIPAKNCLTELLRRAKQTRIVAIAADQAPRRRDEAYWTTFLHQPTPFYLGLEKIATLFNYPVFFLEMERVCRGRYRANFKQIAGPPYNKGSHSVDTHSISQCYVQAVERQILKRPKDWLWMHRRWKKKKSLYN